MSLRVVGYVGRQRIVEDEGPQTARPHQRTYGTRAVVGGSLVTGGPGRVDAGRIATRISMRRLRQAAKEVGL